MNTNKLSEETANKLNELKKAVLESLNNNPDTPHISAISQSKTLEHNAFQGGHILLPRPLIKYDKRWIQTLHRAILQSKDNIKSVIIQANRPDTNALWTVKAKLVSNAEYQTILESRKDIDKQIETELKTIAEDLDWKRLSYGKDNPNNPKPLVIIKTKEKLTKQEATPELTELFNKTMKIYQDFGLDLLVAYWSISKSSPKDFREFFV